MTRTLSASTPATPAAAIHRLLNVAARDAGLRRRADAGTATSRHLAGAAPR